MRPRKWIIVVAILMVVLGTGLYIAKRSIEQNRDIERLLTEYISPAVGGSFDVERVRIGFFSIYLSGVHINVPMQSFSLSVKDIKIGISFRKLLMSHGDFSKSIRKVILISPEVKIYLPDPNLDTKRNVSAKSGNMDYAFHSFPVEYISVKDCDIRLIDHKEDDLIVGEELAGKIFFYNKKIQFELRGKLAANKRNLYLSGTVSEDLSQQHLSIRLDKAKIKKTLTWGRVKVTKGVLDGVCELAFADTVFPYNIDTYGYMTMRDGQASIDSLAEKVKNISMKLSFTNNRVDIDTLSASWNNLDLFINGATGFSPRQETRFTLRCDGIKPEQFNLQSDFTKKHISGKGWIEIKAHKRAHRKKIITSVSAGGLFIGGKQISEISGKCVFDKNDVYVDTLIVEYPGLKAGATGVVNYEKTPLVYSFTINVESGIETFLSHASGDLNMSGSLHGLGSDITLNMVVKGNGIKYDSLLLGNPEIHVRKKGQKISFTSKKKRDAFVTVTGDVDSIFYKDPLLKLKTEIDKEAIFSLFTDSMYNSGFLDTCFASAQITGTVSRPLFQGTFYCSGENLAGECQFSVITNTIDNYRQWSFSSSKFNFSGNTFPVSGSGVITGDTIIFKTFKVLNGVSGKGRVVTGGDGEMNLKLKCRKVQLDQINPWLSIDEKIIQKGLLSGDIKITGTFLEPETRMVLHVSDMNIRNLSSLETDAIITSKGEDFTLFPFVIRKDKRDILSIDTVTNKNHISFSGRFTDIDVATVFRQIIPEDHSVTGLISGSFSTSDSGLPIIIDVKSPRIIYDSWKIDSISAFLTANDGELIVNKISASDASRLHIDAMGYVPLSFMTNKEKEKDTLRMKIKVTGDLLASFEHNVESPVGGTGVGEIDVDMSFANEELFFHSARGHISHGTLIVDPFVPDDAEDISVSMSLDNSSKLHFKFSGKVNRRPVSIYTSHTIPSGIKPIMIGPVNCGIICVETKKNGIDLFLPGFMEETRGNRADIEFASIKPFKTFALSGPLNKLCINGTWIIRSSEFSFPFIDEQPPPEDDPFPYINWNLDLKVGNRKLTYFYNIGGKKRRLMRFLECYLDPSASMSVRGRDIDGTFKLLGSLRSYKGSAFYGRVFNRNFEVGVDFAPHKNVHGKGYDNNPIIWGSAEAFSDSSRFDRIKLSLMVEDSISGTISERGRFYNISFRVSSNFDGMPSDAERDFYHDAGLEFFTLKGAGGVVSSLGDQYIQSYLFNSLERKLAKRLGLDVIRFETSIASNYFNYFSDNENTFEKLADQWRYLALANIGVTVGRYFLRDKVFLKWRTELIPKELFLKPEHSVGLEYQPMEYFWVDFNYGFYRNEGILENNPKIRMQLRLPIGRFRNYFDF